VLLEKLAKGGMAEVHLARESAGEQRLVALKKMLPHLVEDPDFMTMFLDEARIAARLHHPNVVEIYDLGQHGDALFIAMEFVHGEDLRRIEKRCAEAGRPFPPGLACRIVREACKGLDYAHKRADAQGRPLGIVHRDVSPQNLMVSFEGVVKVADFGVAKAADKAHITQSGLIKGKHPYMSPEQALGQEELDCRTDVFALGIVLYEAVTGVRLFRRSTDMQTLRAVAECEVMPPSKVTPGLPPQLDEILLTALARERDRRYHNAAELGSALESFAGSEPEASVVHVGRFVSELFSDRLQREAREKKFAPSFGVTPLATPAAAQRLDFDKAKTIELGLEAPPTAPLRPMPSLTPQQREALPTRESRSKGRPSDSTLRVDDELTLPPDQATAPFGASGGGTGTQAYGQRLPVQTVNTQATEREYDPLRLPPDQQRTILNVDPKLLPPMKSRPPQPAAAQPAPSAAPSGSPSPLPRVFAIVGLALAVAGGWYVVSRGGFTAGSQPTRARPLHRAEPCAQPVKVVTASGKHWVEAPFAEGAALNLFSGPLPNTTQRELYGMAMVVEHGGTRSRIIAENLEGMPEALYACPK